MPAADHALPSVSPPCARQARRQPAAHMRSLPARTGVAARGTSYLLHRRAQAAHCDPLSRDRRGRRGHVARFDWVQRTVWARSQRMVGGRLCLRETRESPACILVRIVVRASPPWSG